MDEYLSDKEIIELSKANPKQVYTCDNGRIALGGMIFKNEQELKTHIKLSMNPPFLLKLMYRAHNLFAKKKNWIDMSVFKKKKV